MSCSLARMEQPQATGLPFPTTTAGPPDSSPFGSKINGDGRGASSSKRPSPPTPEELVAHYEAQGLDTREASLRVIRELQTVLYSTVASGRGRKDRFMAETGRKLDNVSARLGIVELKLDAKPGFPESFAIGVAAGAALQAIQSVVPHVVGAFGKVWDVIGSVTKGHSSPP